MNDHQRKMLRKSGATCGYADGGQVRGGRGGGDGTGDPGGGDGTGDPGGGDGTGRRGGGGDGTKHYAEGGVVDKVADYFLPHTPGARRRAEAARQERKTQEDMQRPIERARRPESQTPPPATSRGVGATDRAEDDALKDVDQSNKANGGVVKKKRSR